MPTLLSTPCASDADVIAAFALGKDLRGDGVVSLNPDGQGALAVLYSHGAAIAVASWVEVGTHPDNPYEPIVETTVYVDDEPALPCGRRVGRLVRDVRKVPDIAERHHVRRDEISHLSHDEFLQRCRSLGASHELPAWTTEHFRQLEDRRRRARML